MIQGILVALLFVGAVAYLGWIVYKQLQAKSACAAGCGKCSVVDFKKIEAELKSKGR
jgi:bacterioferritin-associated ferredoxin